MEPLKSIWNFISNCGVTYSEIKRIKITNQLSAVAFVCYLIFQFSFIYFLVPSHHFDYFLIGVFFPLVIYLNYKGHPNAAKLLLCAVLYFGIFNMMFFYGVSVDSNLLLFPVLQVPFFLFDSSQRKFLWLSLVVPIVFFLFFNLFGISNPAELKLNAEDFNLLRRMNQFTAVVVFFVVIYFYTRLNHISEQSLASRNNLLQEQIHTIFENSSDALLVIDTEKNEISNVNRYAVELFEGTEKEDLVGKQVPDFHRDKLNTEQLGEIRKNLKLRKYWNGEVEFETLKGKPFWGDITVKRIDTSHLTYQLVRVADITERKLHETQMKSSLKEKEILIDEIHHRVKNNLAIISGLLHLQSNQIEDKKLLEIFDESRRRIQSMALIHEKLYHNESLEKIDFSDYVIALIDSIQNSYNTSNCSITVSTNIKNVHLELKHAIPCALILNELISNSYKHAFAGKETGTIDIVINKNDTILSMNVVDNGIGIPSNRDIAQSDTLGLTLVNALVNQIQGDLKIDQGSGTAFYLTFTI
jgi:PAS domain S-box-containing protein